MWEKESRKHEARSWKTEVLRKGCHPYLHSWDWMASLKVRMPEAKSIEIKEMAERWKVDDRSRETEDRSGKTKDGTWNTYFEF